MVLITAPEGAVTYERKSAPAHCTLKISSFDTLLKPGLDKYQSSIFEAEGYKWSLGYAKLLPIAAFKEDNRYLKNGSCTFGAEVLVINHPGRLETLSVVPTNGYDVWVVDNFRSRDKAYYYNKEFTVGDYKWRLKLYPKGAGNEKNSCMSMFLELVDSGNVTRNGKVFIEYKIRVQDQDEETHSTHRESTGARWFSVSVPWGFVKLIPLRDLNDVSKGFIKKNTVIVDVSILSISKVTYKN